MEQEYSVCIALIGPGTNQKAAAASPALVTISGHRGDNQILFYALILSLKIQA